MSHSFCQYVVKDASPLVITDARLDARLAGNLAIEGLDVIAYAGWPSTWRLDTAPPARASRSAATGTTPS